MTENLPERKVVEGTVVGRPTLQYYRVSTTVSRGMFVISCGECGARLHEGAWTDVAPLMTAHVAQRHST